MTDPPSNAVDLVVRRADLLDELRDASRTKPELVARLPVSRSTVDRAVRALEARGLVARGDGVSLTLHGQLVLDAHEGFAATVEAVDAADDVLAPLPRDAELGADLLDGATVVDSDRNAPERATTAVLDEIERATAIRGFTSAILPSTVGLFHERIVENDTTADLTLSEDVLDVLLSSHNDTLHEALDTGRLTLREAGTELSYSLLLFERPERTVVTALVYGDRGLAGVVKNDAEAAVEWAERVCADVCEDATPLPT